MTAALVLLVLVTYLGGGALLISSQCRRIDAEFRAGMHAVLRSRSLGGSEHPQTAGAPQPPAVWGVRAGVEPARRVAPPAPLALVGAADPRHAAPTRPPRRTVLLSERACGYGMHKCACGAGACLLRYGGDHLTATGGDSDGDGAH